MPKGKIIKRLKDMTPTEIEAERIRRKKYMHDYYLAHRGKALQYAKKYRREHPRRNPRKRGRKQKVPHKWKRQSVCETYHHSDIMHAPVEKALKILAMILSGERQFTM